MSEAHLWFIDTLDADKLDRIVEVNASRAVKHYWRHLHVAAEILDGRPRLRLWLAEGLALRERSVDIIREFKQLLSDDGEKPDDLLAAARSLERLASNLRKAAKKQ